MEASPTRTARQSETLRTGWTRPTLPAGYWAPLGAVTIWSMNSIVTKQAATAINPASIALYRWLLALLILTPFLARPVWRRRSAVAAHWPKLAVLGGLGMATYQGLAYQAALTTSATDMGVILALMPLVSALLAAALAGEPMQARRILGGAVSLAGLVIMTTRGHPSSLLRGAATGDVLMLVAVIANSLYGVLLKRWEIPLTTWQQIYIQAAFGALFLLPFWLWGEKAPITQANAGLILFAAVAASLGAPYLWITSVKQIGAARSALFVNLLPPLVALMAWITWGEALTLPQLIGGAIALIGVRIGLR